MATRKTVTKLGADSSEFKGAVDNMTKALNNLNRKIVDNKAAQKEANKTISDAQKELAKVEKEVKENGKATDEQKQKIKDLNALIDSEKNKLAGLITEQGKLKAALKETNREIEKSKESTVDFKTAADNLGTSLGSVKAASAQVAADITAVGAAATGAAAGMLAFVGDAAKWADDLNTLSSITGITTNELQKMQYASNLIDVDVTTVTGSLTKLTKAMSSAKDGSGTAAEAFKTLRVNIIDAVDGSLRDRQEVFSEVIDALGKIESETERDALAMTVLGKSAEQLNPLIKGGADQLKALGDEAERAGLILDQKTIDSLHSFNDQVDTLKAQGGQLTKILASQAKPAVEDIVKLGENLLTEVNGLAKSGAIEGMARDAAKLIRQGVDNLKKLLEFINQNKEAIVGFTAAVVAFKIAFDVGNLISTLITAFGALKTVIDAAKVSQLELNAAMSANPIGIVLGLLSALTVGIIAYNAATKEAQKSTDEYAVATERAVKAIEDYDRALQTSQDKYAETIANGEAEAALLDKLGDRYEELRETKNRSTAQDMELKTIAVEIAGALGITTEELIDQSGNWKEINSQIEEHISKLKEEAQLQATAELYKDTIKERARAEIELGKAEKARAEYYEAHKDKIDNAFKDGYRIDMNEEYQEYSRLSNAVEELTSRVEDSAESEKAAADEVERVNKLMTTGSSAAGTYANGLSDAADSAEDMGDALSVAQDNLTEANKRLLNNQEFIRTLKTQLKEAEKAFRDAEPASEEFYAARDRMNNLKDMIAMMQTKQTSIRSDIAKLKAEIKELGNVSEKTAADFLSELKSISDLMEKVKSETAEGGSLTLSTLQSIMSKYPELTDTVNDYINGLKSEGDILSGLKDIYNRDVDNYNSAVAIKKLTTESFSADCSDEVKKLINKYNEQYGIDIRNYANATAAKAAAHQSLINKMTAAEAEYRKIADENNYIVFQNAYGRTVHAKNADGSLREISGAELAAYDKTRQAYFDAQAAVRNFDADSFTKKFTDDITSLYGGTNADALGRLTGSGSSSGSGSGSKTADSKWTMNSLGVYASGNSAVSAELQWLDRVTALGKVNEQQQKTYLNNWLKSTQMNADERYEIEKRLYDLNKKLSEKAAQEREKAAEDEQKNRLKRLEYASEAYQKLVKGQIEVYNQNTDKIKADLEAKTAALDEELARYKQQKEDDKRQDEINQLNLRLRYAQLSETERRTAEKQREKLLQEQADAEYEKNIEARKSELQEAANYQIEKNTSAIERLNNAIEDAVYYFAKLSGSQTVSQVVNNSTKNQTTNYIRAGLTEAEANRLLKTIY